MEDVATLLLPAACPELDYFTGTEYQVFFAMANALNQTGYVLEEQGTEMEITKGTEYKVFFVKMNTLNM